MMGIMRQVMPRRNAGASLGSVWLTAPYAGVTAVRGIMPKLTCR
ncbi:hypothetical protein [Methyloglobulus sp.]